MPVSDPCLIRSRGSLGEPVVRLGMPLVEDYLEFLTGRCRPNTVLAAAYDLKGLCCVGRSGGRVEPAGAGQVASASSTKAAGSRRWAGSSVAMS